MSNSPNNTLEKRTRNLLTAEFDSRLKTYTLILVSLILVATIAGILLIPFWLLLGRYYINRYFNNLSCELTSRALHFKKGVWIQTERTIPLDKIQDLSFREGPLLRQFGLSTLSVETAGNSQNASSDLSLTGIIDAQDFRLRVLDERDRVTDNKSGIQSGSFDSETSVVPILKEIRDSLKSIESRLKSN